MAIQSIPFISVPNYLKGTNAVTQFNPAGYVTMNLGRRPEGYEPHEHIAPEDARHVDGYFNGPTDVGWDPDDNTYVSDGYVNSRVAKFDKHGNRIKPSMNQAGNSDSSTGCMGFRRI